MRKTLRYITWLILLLHLSSCNQKSVNRTNIPTDIKSPKLELIGDSVLILDKSEEVNLNSEFEVKRYFYPNMSRCGGALYGLYKSEELIRIESTYGAEMGYSENNIDFQNGELVKIAYREHFAEWEKYYQKYPNDNDIDPKLMTYTDTLYILEFKPNKQFKKYAGDTLISTEIKDNLVKRLIECTETMKKELNSEKKLVKK